MFYKKITFLLFIINFIGVPNINAQTVIQGIITNDTAEGLAGASVIIVDSTTETITESLSDSSGNFKLMLNRTGFFYLKVSFIGYKTYSKEIVIDELHSDKDTIITINVVLVDDEKMLGEVIIAARQKTRVQNIQHGIELIPGTVMKQPQLSALSIVKVLPGVFYKEGEIEILGQKVQHIYLHQGNEGQGLLISKDKINAIKSDDVLKIQLLNGQDIHIFLRKGNIGYSFGLSTSLSAGKKIYGSFDPYFKLNTGSFYLKISDDNSIDKRLSVTESEWLGNGLGGVPALYHSSGEVLMTNKMINPDIVMEKTFKKDFVLGAQFQMQFHGNEIESETILKSENKMYPDVYAIQSNVNNKTNVKYFIPNIFFSKKFDSGRTTLSGNVGFSQLKKQVKNRSDFRYNLNDSLFGGNQLLDQKNAVNYFFNELILRQRINSKLNFSMTEQWSFFKNNSDNQLSQKMMEAFGVDSVFSNRFQETQIRLKPQLNWEVNNKNSLSMSALVFHYLFNYQSIGFKNSILKVLPSASYSLTTNKDKIISFYWNSGITAPNVQNFLFKNLSYDGITENVNNFYLKPYSYNQYGFNFPIKEIFLVNMYFTRTRNRISHAALFDANGAFLGDRVINVFRQNEWALSLNYSQSVSEHIFLSMNSAVSYNTSTNRDADFNFNLNYVSFSLNGSVYYTGKKGLTLYSNVLFISEQPLGNEIYLKPLFQLDMSGSQTLGKHFSVFANLSNILNTYKPHIFAKRSFIYDMKSDWDYRSFQVGFRYKFENKFKEKRLNNTPLRSINNRMLNEK